MDGVSGYEFDLHRQEPRRAGDVIPVEPQVFDPPAPLIERRERILTGDQYPHVLWSRRIVSEPMLNSRFNTPREVVGDSWNGPEVSR